MEQFGDATTNPKGLPTALIRDVAECYAGATPSTKVAAYWDDATIPWMSSGEVHNGRVSATEKKISQAGYDSCSTKMIALRIPLLFLKMKRVLIRKIESLS